MNISRAFQKELFASFPVQHKELKCVSLLSEILKEQNCIGHFARLVIPVVRNCYYQLLLILINYQLLSLRNINGIWRFFRQQIFRRQIFRHNFSVGKFSDTYFLTANFPTSTFSDNYIFRRSNFPTDKFSDRHIFRKTYTYF